MPNLKIFVEESVHRFSRQALVEALAPMRAMLCDGLAVTPDACQFAVVPVLTLPDMAAVNVEMTIMLGPERTRERVTDIGLRLRAIVERATGAHAAVRISQLDPQTYVALK
ncbi:hypothetical protein [Aureimonas sp. ME7]|uniref:hypothetical protein n=1 Tax=Aureimonas sp. ME7 TaxID=2744252 RepID=UPI0015F71149|nr:hypothetical protein [Aureimonas sp. ME7]